MPTYIPSILLSAARNPVTAVGLPLSLGILSGLPSHREVDSKWYNSLTAPPGRPPRQAFPIAWSLLYASMGYASHLAVNAYDSALSTPTRDDASLGLALYYGSLGLNFLWPPLFFVLKRTELALADISLLTGTVLYLTKLLHGPTGGNSTYLLVPYCAWLINATYLNAGIWWLNRNREVPKDD